MAAASAGPIQIGKHISSGGTSSSTTGLPVRSSRDMLATLMRITAAFLSVSRSK